MVNKLTQGIDYNISINFLTLIRATLFCRRHSIVATFMHMYFVAKIRTCSSSFMILYMYIDSKSNEWKSRSNHFMHVPQCP